ncbi:MAG: phosphoribosylamine--glycine ligase [Muribaculaceae bacterium]|nr:phosphoribosylamine--glycine ligase [Muribaculaceae bacterium]
MNQQLNILLIGQGGRESALAWKILGSPRIGTLYTAPGYYPGAIQATGLALDDFEAVAEFVERHAIDITLVGPTEYMMSGLVDYLLEQDMTVIGPPSGTAVLETSKEQAKDFMTENIIPTPRCMSVTQDTVAEGLAFMDSRRPPYVLKADGLSRGCGVWLIDNLADAKDMLADMLDGRFGEASETVLIEDFVEGRECSVFAALDGENYLMLTPAQDYKRLFNGNRGPNTAGMGAYSPVGWADPAFLEKVERRIVIPTVNALRERGELYRGFLYLGIKNDGGEPVLLEYNVRLGDPEAQVILPRMESDILDLLEAMAEGTLGDYKTVWSPQTCVGVVVAGAGYPSGPMQTEAVDGLEEAEATGCLVFPDDLTKDATGRIVTSGGRVVTLVGVGGNLATAAATAFEGAERIRLDNKHFRTDIGTPESD